MVDTTTAIGIGLAILGVIIEHFHYQAKLQERIAKLEAEFVALKGIDVRLAEITTKISLFWGALEDQVPRLLMKGNPIDPDSELYTLLGKLRAQQITDSELGILSEELKKEIKNPEHSTGEKVTMAIADALVKSKLGIPSTEEIPVMENGSTEKST